MWFEKSSRAFLSEQSFLVLAQDSKAEKEMEGRQDKADKEGKDGKEDNECKGDKEDKEDKEANEDKEDRKAWRKVHGGSSDLRPLRPQGSLRPWWD